MIRLTERCGNCCKCLRVWDSAAGNSNPQKRMRKGLGNELVATTSVMAVHWNGTKSRIRAEANGRRKATETRDGGSGGDAPATIGTSKPAY